MRKVGLSHILSQELGGLRAYEAPVGGFPVKLDANENPFAPPGEVSSRIKAALEKEDLNRYPDPSSRQLRASFARRFGCDPENVMAGNGSDELIGFLLWALRGRQGAGRPAVLLPVPTFPMYAIAAQAAGFRVCEVPLTERLEPDLEGLVHAVQRERPNILFLSSPNNPTGTLFSREVVGPLLAASGGLVVVDEAYGDFSGEDSWVSRVSGEGNLAVLRTLSKVGGAALRCGFLVAPREVLEAVNKVRFPFNVSRYTQLAGGVFLDHFHLFHPQIEAIVRERERLGGALAGLGMEVFPSRGNFLLVQCRGREEDLWRFWKEKGIITRFLAGLAVTGDALRVTVGRPEENELLIRHAESFSAASA